MTLDYDLATGHAGIDEDHAEVVDVLTSFLTVLDVGPRDEIPAALSAFHTRVISHFAYEEQLMADAAYAATKDHMSAHASFLADTRKFADRLATEGVTEPFRVWAHGRLVTWFRFHIRAYDIALAHAVLAREPAARPA